jgi:vacuolar protein sorting-associated protein 45
MSSYNIRNAEVPMDIIAAIRSYMDRIVHADHKCAGMKVLLLDSVTTLIVSAVYSQTEILQQQVYLVSRLDDNVPHNQQSSHLSAVLFVRPTSASVEWICHEIEHPRYKEYHVFFSAIVSGGLLRKLAEHDVHERIRQVQEYYADVIPINEDLAALQCGNRSNSLAMTVAAGTSQAPQHAALYERTVQGVQSILLALKRQPTCIRYAKQSACAEEIANDVYDAIQADDVFQFKKKHGTLLLILDRRDDPVTPLLSQWTYQAMVHELLGINNHRVLLKGAPNVSKDLEEVVLTDTFFVKNRHLNFGDLGEAIQRLLNDYQSQTALHQQEQLNSIEAMQAFMDKFPELRSRSHTVSKHVAIMGELARLVQVNSLMDVSQLEQDLACKDDSTAHWRELRTKLESGSVDKADKLRLALLYALRYEQSANLHLVQSTMSKGGVSQDGVDLVNTILRYGGVKSRGPGLYGDDHNLMSKMTKSFITSVHGVENVYSQHVPLVMDTLQSILKGKLSTKTHPIVPGSATDAGDAVPQDVVIFMVGGITYEEGTKVAEFNQQMKGRMRVILAGSTVHNSTSFLDELKDTNY